MKKGMKTLLVLAVLYLIYLAAKFLILRKRFAVSREKTMNMKDDAGARNIHGAAKGMAKHAEDTALDPVCGRYVPISGAISLGASGDKLYFCSGACRDAFTSRAGGGSS